MDITQQTDLLYMLKALADEQRLTMLGLLSEREYTITELAERLKLTEPTISHHVRKLRESGLVTLRMAGNQHFCRTNESRIARFKSYVAEIDTPPTAERAKDSSDNAWIDALDWSDEDKKILRSHTFDGRLVRMPVKDKKWLVILRWAAARFEPGVRYSEKEVNAILTEINADYATLRRSLVEYGFMRRERGGGDYWLAAEEETPA